MFEQYSSALHQKYPGLLIEGDNYPPTSMKYYLAQILGLAKIVAIIAIVSNTDPFPWFGMETPALFTSAMENKVYACLMLFFIGNAIEGQLISTGAFEIIFNDQPVWSKLETGRIPQPNEIVQIIENHMNLGGGGPTSAFNPEF